MNYAAAIQFLFGLQLFGARPGLERTHRLIAHFGNLHEQLRFIHVAGTNGKGSTCAMLESIYRAAGLRVGLFTSPHLISFRERIQINRQLISESEVARLTAEVIPVLQTFPPDEHPTMFEVVTVMALRHFTEQQCDLVIWETGLGGRLDATNIVTPLASIITSIGLDHQQWLGETLAQITSEKAGIIKPGVPVITGAAPLEVLEVIEAVAGNQSAPLKCVTADLASDYLASIALLGPHQIQNAALAIATVQVLQSQIAVSPAAIHTGLQTVYWPGRLQIIAQSEGRKILIDGAHNEAGITALLQALQDHFPAMKPTFVAGMLSDKNWRWMVTQLAQKAGRILTVPVASVRTVTPSELAAECKKQSAVAVIECQSLTEALGKTANDSFVVIVGSLYLVGEALELLGLAVTKGNERQLNDWKTYDPQDIQGRGRGDSAP